MKRYPMTPQATLVLQPGDITQVRVQAIVNAANQRMLGGGGVDGAIHRAAGPDLLAACKQVPQISPRVRCPTGQARITPGFALPAPWVIHTVGPVYRGPESRQLLASCYRSSLKLAAEHEIKTIAFPAISCGVYGYPVDDAASVALEICRDNAEYYSEIRFVLFDPSAHAAWQAAADRLYGS